LLRNRGIELWLRPPVIACKARGAGRPLLQEHYRIAGWCDAATYHAIRGVDALPRYVRAFGWHPSWVWRSSIRVTLQRANYRQLPEFVALARELKLREVSFLAVDVRIRMPSGAATP